MTRFVNPLLVFLPLLSLSSLSLAQPSSPNFFAQADAFFSQFVQDQQVDYRGIQQNPQVLYQLIREVARYDLEGMSPKQQQAFFINAYNLQVIRSVVDRWPIASPQEVPGFFDETLHVTAGESYTLNELEKEVIFARFPDPRLHFALVCAAKGCPPLVPTAYKSETLEDQLNQQTRLALNDPAFIRVNPEKEQVEVSQLFQWYASDFRREANSILAYINSFRNTPIPMSYSTRYYPYDWRINSTQSAAAGLVPSSNVQQFTPSVLLKKGQVEIKVFNNLYTQTAFRDNNRKRVDLNQRETFFTGIFQFNYGVSQNRRWNVGFEVDYSAVRLDADESSSPLRVLGTRTENLIFRKSTISYIGPRIRFAPFRSLKKFSITSTLQIPVSNDLELFADGQQRFLAHNRVNWWTQFFYDKTFGQWQIFTEVDFLYRFPTNQVSFNQDAFFLTPVIAFLSYFPDPKSTLNVNVQYWPTFQGLPGNSAGEGFSLSGDFVQVGIGGKYQLTPELNLEVIYTNFLTSRNNGAGQTFNVGLVFIK